jgi:hypothetical protein
MVFNFIHCEDRPRLDYLSAKKKAKKAKKSDLGSTDLSATKKKKSKKLDKSEILYRIAA